jgi:uncharacterized protein
MPKIWFSSIVILLIFVWYTFFKISHLFGANKILTILLTLLLFIVMIGWELLYRYDLALVNILWFRMIAWVGSTMLGIWITFILFSMFVDCTGIIFGVIAKVGNSALFDHLHKIVSSPNVVVGLLIISILIAGLGLKTALSGPKVVEVFVPVNDMANAINNLKIVQISDLHVGPLIRRGYVEKVVDKINELKPDIIVFTGDAADGKSRLLKAQLEPLTKLQAPYGKFYVTGNHEYYWGGEEWVGLFHSLGFLPLINENRVINYSGIRILMGGITDISGGQFVSSHWPDVKRAGLSPEPVEFKILLSHSPRVYGEAEKLGFDLQLSGHTHAGQFFPFSLLVPLVHKYHSGLNREGRLWLYINSGTGSWGPVNRFGVHSEITIIRFKR